MTRRMPPGLPQAVPHHTSAKADHRRHSHPQQGAAIVTALLTVALVAALAVAAFWSQWRSIEMEAAQRQRLQDDWLLSGALDWARSRLHDDGVDQGAVDHLGEPWAQAVRDAPLAGFLSGNASGNTSGGALGSTSPATGDWPPLFLSLQLSDAQGRMNVLNLIEGATPSPAWLSAFGRLFSVLGLPAEQLGTLVANLRLAQASSPSNNPTSDQPGGPTGTPKTTGASTAPLLPHDLPQLVWLGLPPETVAALQAHVTLLPGRTPVNLNTASPQVLQAVLPNLSRAAADQLVAQRTRQPFAQLADTGLTKGLDPMLHSVNSRFFQARAELRSQPGASAGVARNALLQRERADVRVLWLRRDSLSMAPPDPPHPP